MPRAVQIAFFAKISRGRQPNIRYSASLTFAALEGCIAGIPFFCFWLFLACGSGTRV